MLVNLHTHLEGRIRPNTAVELATGLGLTAPDRGWEEALQLDGPADLTVYLDKISTSYPFFSDHDSLARIAREAVEDAAADGEDYLELRFGPASYARADFSLIDIISAVTEGVSDGSQRTGMPAGVVVAALRHQRPRQNEAVARAAARFAGRGVVGFDLAGDELRFPQLHPHVNAFAIARASGLGLTCHAAEAAPGVAAGDAVDLFHVTRIGHGAHIIDDPRVLRRMADEGIVVEICPTSNLYTSAIERLSEHPGAEFVASGVAVVLGDDNPRQTGSLLSGEARVLRDVLGLTPEQMLQIDRDSINAGFMEENVRVQLRARLDKNVG